MKDSLSLFQLSHRMHPQGIAIRSNDSYLHGIEIRTKAHRLKSPYDIYDMYNMICIHYQTEPEPTKFHNNLIIILYVTLDLLMLVL